MLLGQTRDPRQQKRSVQAGGRSKVLYMLHHQDQNCTPGAIVDLAVKYMSTASAVL